VPDHRGWGTRLATLALLAVAGCGQRTEVAGMAPPEAPPLAEGERAIPREEWTFEPLVLTEAAEVRVSATLASGPAVDMYVVTEAGFDRWNTIVRSSMPMTELDVESVPMLGLEGLAASFTSEWTVLAPGKYYLLLDNTSSGGTAPPAPGTGDLAMVRFTIGTRTAPP
jgi:hypothetical protein